MVEKRDTVAVKRPSSEQRKLRSRDAARYRRSQETEVYYELAGTLPFPRRVSTNLDKCAIMRASLSYLWMRRLLRPASESQKDESEEEGEKDPMDAFYPQVLPGFIMVVNEEGDVIYLMENVSRYIGLTQLDLLGQSLFDFIHPCDQEELRDLLAPHSGVSKKLAGQRSERNFFLRMKSTLTSRGRTVNIKSASWKVLHCTGHMRPFGDSSSSPQAARVMTVLCEPIPHPTSVEFPLDSCTFLTRHSMDLRFTHCEGRVTELVGYKPEDLIGRSAYEFHHARDSGHVIKSLHTLVSKGQVSTSQYRFLANSGGFVWTETQATVLYSSKTSQPEAIVCLNFILSAVEQPDVVFSFEQIRCSQAERSPPAPEGGATADTCDPDPVNEHLASPNPTEDEAVEPSGAAELFSGLKENPNELLQPAPEAGDAVPLTELAELSFFSPPSPDTVPDCPQDMCTPQLLQLLTPIFNASAPPPSSSSSPDSPSSCEEEMDASNVEKFFAVYSEDGQREGERLKNADGADLDMLAPYISMDDDFQLTFCSSLLEEADQPSPSSSEPSTVMQPVTGSRKRTHELDEMLSQLGKRQKEDTSSEEEELLLNHRLQACLDELDKSKLALGPEPAGLNQLLSDRDPLLGGGQGLCDTAALMRNMFICRPPDLSTALSHLT